MPQAGYDEVALVTGFPTFRARAMMSQLLEDERKALVYAVIRSKFEAEARDVIERLPAEQRARVVPLAGDAAAIDLGLSGREFREVAGRVDRIHHLAQVTYYGASRALAESVNLGATREVLELGLASPNLKSLVIHSSAFVCGRRKGLVREDELSTTHSFRSPIEETLARAEVMARSVQGKLPLVVVRPAQLVGDSRTGEIDRLDGAYMLIALILAAPDDFPMLLPVRGDAPMHLVPIDAVMRIALKLSQTSAAVGGTFHIADTEPLSVRRVFELVAAAGGKRLPHGFVPSRVSKAVLRTPGVHRLSRGARAFIDQIATTVRFDTANLRRVLAESDRSCPPFESYVERVVAFVRRRTSATAALDDLEHVSGDDLPGEG